MIVRGLIISSPSSGAGKTTVALGLMHALTTRGLRVRGMKSGPDYIDPAFHRAATGQDSFNLDSFAMPPPLLGSIVAHAADEQDLLIVEGAMGLFDGARGPAGRRGSAADLARRYGWPVVLVIDCRAMSQTAAAVALGLARFDPSVRVAGVILNNIASERHLAGLRDAFAALDLPLLAALPRDPRSAVPERHLGLVQAGEIAALEDILDWLAAALEKHSDVGALAALAHGGDIPGGPMTAALAAPGTRIAIARDAAFSFIYPHLVAGWRASGAAIVFFSPLNDEPPPADCDACFLPGGYPELHAAKLAATRNFFAGLRTFAATRPVHGECGGYMVLGETLHDAGGAVHEMAGLLPVVTSFAERRLTLGYRHATPTHPAPFGNGQRLAGHEFHYATMTSPPPAPDQAFASFSDADGQSLGFAGHRAGNVSGSFFHAIAAAGSGEADAA
jgi:cobyrinic acid a,c-diamide synthase